MSEFEKIDIEEEQDPPLHLAVVDGNIDLVEKLLKKNSINSTNQFGQTALHIACGRGQLRCVELLLKKGHADLSALDEDGLTPALYAARSGFVAVMHMLVENGSNLQDKDPNGRSLLHYAAGNGRAAMVRYLTRSGMDINCVDSKGNTPLHLIAQANSVDSIKLVLRLGGSNVKNFDGQTPEEVAVVLDHQRAAKTIRNFKATPEELLKPDSGPWIWLPWVLPILLNSSVFFVLNWSNLFVWTVLLVSWVMFFYIYGERVAPGDGTGYSSPFAFAHVIVLLLFAVISYYMFFALHLPTTEFLALHIFFWIVSITGGVAFYQCHTRDPGYVSKEKSGLDSVKNPQLPDYGFCESCRIVRPLRSKHCQACDRCVALFDHHCPWIYNCVGRNNMVHFFVFLLCVFIAIPIYFAAGIVWITSGLHEELGVGQLGFFLWTFYLGAHFLFVTSLLYGQLQHVLLNMTTAEKINKNVNPHRYVYLSTLNEGPKKNCLMFFGTPCRDIRQDPGYGLTTADAF